MSRSTQGHSYTNYDGPESAMLLTKFLVIGLSVPEETIFKVSTQGHDFYKLL